MKALICGAGGQDGTYLAQLLLGKGYEVIGTSRNASAMTFANMAALGIQERVRAVSMAGNDFRSVLSTLRTHKPDEIYSLAGQSSPGLSFDQPVETMESIALSTLNLLEAVRFEGRAVRVFNAGSSECFGDSGEEPAVETTPFHPRSPYAVAKVTAHHLVSNYRKAYGLHVCTGVLFNHESPFRPERFVTQKIVRAAARIAKGRKEVLKLGNRDIYRDWGWAPDYVDAMWRILQADKPEDFIIATGRTESLEYYVAGAFRYFGLNWRDHVAQDDALLRPLDIRCVRANPAKALERLAWRATNDIDDVIEKMCRAAEAAVD